MTWTEIYNEVAKMLLTFGGISIGVGIYQLMKYRMRRFTFGLLWIACGLMLAGMSSHWAGMIIAMLIFFGVSMLTWGDELKRGLSS